MVWRYGGERATHKIWCGSMQRFPRNLSLRTDARTDARTDDGRTTTDACAMTVAKNKYLFEGLCIPHHVKLLNINLKPHCQRKRKTKPHTPEKKIQENPDRQVGQISNVTSGTNILCRPSHSPTDCLVRALQQGPASCTLHKKG